MNEKLFIKHITNNYGMIYIVELIRLYSLDTPNTSLLKTTQDFIDNNKNLVSDMKNYFKNKDNLNRLFRLRSCEDFKKQTIELYKNIKKELSNE